MLGLILLLGLTVRLLLAPFPGYTYDVATNMSWARNAVTFGLAQTYTPPAGEAPNYPPLSITIFALSGHLYALGGGRSFAFESIPWRIAIKMPAILADLLICMTLFVLVSHWKNRTWGLLSATAYALHPAALYDSAYWGQTDAIYTLLSLLSILCLAQKRWMLCGALIVLALLTKLHAIVFVPLIGLVLLGERRRLLCAAIGGGIALAVVLLPFASPQSLAAIVDVYSGSTSYHPHLVNGAYNLWWALHLDKAWATPSTATIGPLTYRALGLLLFGSAYAILLWKLRHPLLKRSATKTTTEALLLTAAGASLAFFTLNAQMHERYLFPFVAIALPLLFTTKSGAALYIGVSTLFFFNLLGVLPSIDFVKSLYEMFPTLDGLFASGMVFCLVLYLVYVWERGKAL